MFILLKYFSKTIICLSSLELLYSMKQLTTLSLLLIALVSNKFYSQCNGTEPVIFLGNDTTLCNGASLALNAASGYNAYVWSNGSTAQSINVTSSGTYIVSATMTSGGNNLVINGDFENGATNFYTDYIPGTGGAWGLLSNPGQYAISTSPNLVHNNFYPCGDHTTGTGKMFIANGSDVANTIVWQQTITVIPNTNYNFSAWVTSVENTNNPAILQFFVDNVQIGTVFSPSNTGCDWHQFFNLWNSGGNTSAIICIKNQNIDGAGNDFALDDITFTSYCTNTDTIVVTIDNTIIDAGPNTSFCDTSPNTITAHSNNPSTTFLWNTGESTATITPNTSGEYYVTTTTVNGCNLIDSTLVTIYSSPTAINITTTDATCDLNNGQVQIGSLTGGALPFQYNFNNTGLSSSTTYSNLTAASYTLTVQDANGCTYSSTPIVISDIPGPSDINLTSQNTSCTLNDGIITVLSVTGGQQPYSYTINNGTFSGNSSFQHLISGSYSVTVKDVNSCVFSKSISITSPAVPIANFSTPEYVTDGQTASFINQTTGTITSNNWSIPDGTPNSSSSINASATFTNLEPGFYPVTLTVINQDGCMDTVVKFIEFRLDPSIFVPNAFTPDGDSFNNTWKFFLAEYDSTKFSVQVFNRWGEKIWESHDMSSSWDGTYRGNLVQSGIYTWVISTSNLYNDDVQLFKGHLSVLY